MKNLRDFVKWIAQQNAINLSEDQLKEMTGWMIENKKYLQFQEDLIKRMKVAEKK